MEILVITNMYPSREKSYAGIFVKNQYEELKRVLDDESSVEIFFMKRQFTSRLGSLFKFLKAFISFIPYYFKKYDIIHLHFFFPLIYLAWFYKKLHPNCRVVVTFHGIDITKKINDKNKEHYQKIAKCIDFTIPVGSTLGKMVEEKLKLDIGVILSVGVNNHIFKFIESQKKYYDFIFVGSFIERKGIDTIIESISILSNKNIKYCFCGSGNYYASLKRLQDQGFNITIKQNQTQSEVSKLLNQSRFFLIMSRNEGFPTVTIESMFCGLPAITSDIPQFREQINTGVNGYMVPVNNADELSRTISFAHKMPKDEYETLVNNALNSFNELSLQNVCKKLVRIYKKLKQD